MFLINGLCVACVFKHKGLLATPAAEARAQPANVPFECCLQVASSLHFCSPIQVSLHNKTCCAAATPQIEVAWEWDAFAFAEATSNHPLSTLGFFILQRTGMVAKFDMNTVKLARFLRRVESGYPDNPYHR